MDELKEKIARIIAPFEFAAADRLARDDGVIYMSAAKDEALTKAQAALTAIEEAGCSGEWLRKLAFKLSCADRFRLASFIAENVGYVLTPDPLRGGPDEPQPGERSYATLSDSATAFDPEKQFEKDNGI